ncbi:MAG: class I SAM-dependent methyltransferase [Bacteroidales bacterium]|nr:class I SAM-dependent methyltransferase [Bacteroidales bacterium]
MALSDKLLGNNREHIPNMAFRLMALVMKVMDILGYYDKNFKTLEIKKYRLTNTRVVLSNGYSYPEADHTADVVLALDMFHMIQVTNALLREFSRIVKPSGVVIIEDGHQPSEQTKVKIIDSGFFRIIEETKGHVKFKVSNKK